jgi:hypothetical protein
MKRHLTLGIGHEKLGIYLKHCNRRFGKSIKRRFRTYLSPSDRRGIKINFLFYSRNRSYKWNPAERERIRRNLLLIHRRHPMAKRIDETIAETLTILSRFNPDEPHLHKVRRILTGSETPVQVLAGPDVFVCDQKANTAYFLLKKHRRPSNKHLGVINGIMFVLSLQLIRNGGLLVHGAAVQRNGKLALFLGLSGSGKTTAANCCRPDICFSDDGAIIREELNRFFVYYSPFRQIETDKNSHGRQKGEINRIFLLNKKGPHGVSPIKKSELMHLMLMHHIHFMKYMDRDTAQMCFYRVKKMVGSIPAYRLSFDRSEDIWDLLW